jgi:hypothetical protein
MFTAAINGNPPPFGYALRKLGTNLTSFVSPERQCVFTIPNVTTNHSGTWRIVVTNAAIVTPGVPSSFANLTVLADTDGDGMPDTWETTYSFNPGSPADATGDADGDHMTNVEEYRAGTNPQDNLSFLRIESIESELATTGSMRVSFLAVSNRTYAVEYRDTLIPGAWTPMPQVSPATTNRMIEMIDSPPATISKRYYRLAIPPAL